jgi:Flp pilus assembly protein TadG
MNPNTRRTPHSQQGVAAVEMALVLIPLMLLLFGITEFGRALYLYNTIAKATRDGARYLSTQGPGDASEITSARCLVVYGNTACTGSPLVPGLTTGQVSVCDASAYTGCGSTHASQPTGSGVINLVTVRVTGYAFTSAVPFLIQSITFNDISTTMRQVL